MKRIISILLFLFMLFPVIVSAESTEAFGIPSEFMKYDTVFDKTEFELIIQQISDDVILTENNITMDLSMAYKLYDPISHDIVSEILSGKSVTELLSDSYVWMLITNSGKQITVIEKDGEWSVAGYSDPPTGIASSNIIQANSVATIVGDSQIIPESIYFLRSSMYHTNFALVIASNEEYMIPFGSRPDLTGLENGKLYSPVSTATLLESSFVYAEDNDNSGIDNGGAYIGNHHVGMIDEPIIFVIVSLFILFTVAMVTWKLFRLRKSKTK